MIDNIVDAKAALTEARIDAIMDFGEELADAAHNDLVRAVADRCVSEVAAELLRREGVAS